MAKSINIGIINSGIANIASVVNMLKKIGFSSEIINNANEYEENISHIIIPGIGSYDQGIKNIKNKSFDSIIYKHIESEKPILGICLGMQLLGIGSEEGLLDGFKIINQKCIKFNLNEDYAIPHMGWNYVYPKKERVIIEGINLIKRHTRPSQDNPQGGIIEKESTIHISNIKLVVGNKETKVGYKRLNDGQKVRFSKKNVK